MKSRRWKGRETGKGELLTFNESVIANFRLIEE